MMLKKIIIVIVIFNFLRVSKSSKICLTDACERESKFIRDKLDSSVDPCDDFHKHVCGKYIEKLKIPDDQMTAGISSDMIHSVKSDVYKILKENISNNDIEPFKKSKKFFKSCMNEDLINKKGLKPMKDILKSLGGWPVVEGIRWRENSWQNVLIDLRLRGIYPTYIYEDSIYIDFKNASRYVIYVDRMSTSFYGANIYNDLENKSSDAYYNYQVKSAILFGASKNRAKADMKEVLKFTIQLLNVSYPFYDETDEFTMKLNYMKVKELQELFPIHNWVEYLNKVYPNNKITSDETIGSFEFKSIVKDVYALLRRTPNRVIVNYLMWRTVQSFADDLNDEMRALDLELEKQYTGRSKHFPRWEKCVDSTLQYFPAETSSLYVRNHFSKESKYAAMLIANSIQNEFENTLSTNDWMDIRTKGKALKKLNNLRSCIGYPDKLVDDNELIKYSKNFEIIENDFFNSVLNIRKIYFDTQNRKLRKPFNRNHWEECGKVTDHNLINNLVTNTIEGQAGILHGAVFSLDRPQYLNYGGFGSSYGHEIIHGYIGKGTQFDGSGIKRDWLQEYSKKNYKRKIQCIIDQYNDFEDLVTGENVDGEHTHIENIADNGGIRHAYMAYIRYVKEKGEEQSLPNLNYTPRQLFWISSVYLHCNNQRPDSLEHFIKNGKHSPEKFRINGQVSNMPQFAKDFNCPLDSNMNPRKKCTVW